MSEASRITVKGESPYDVVIGTGVLDELPGLVGGRARTVAVIYSGATPRLATPVLEALEKAGYTAHGLPVPDGEGAKSVEVLAGLWTSFAALGVTRSDAVVGVGGGAVTDLAGFAAASWLRGVRCVLVPTTLLAMVDAAVGGKTGINIAAGKNLVGAFAPPAGVLCELDALATVPHEDYISGLAETIKAGFIRDPRVLELVEEDPAGAASPHGPHTRELVERAVRVKADVVGADLKEAGLREILNYGHTLAHAIEKIEDYRFRHGHAVAIGCVYAAELSRLDGRIDADLVARHRAVFASVGLPVTYKAEAWPALRSVMNVDKKTRGATLRFVVLDSLAECGRLEGPAEELLQAAYLEVAR
ncbi:3-dehydroquinate synthase [Actinocorallia sp. API 0066]|uniref:3-dehydroquinate synthase n=1 Tax=Actinocorallia sp. API 0066 TaxID=2896846 RepID=UPI001E465F08|nr:3-dehydroquinate synthase [Actinocorallia sp. API 0066]MCD0450872.1 3-dehydroquinate synthase [Actinocorallia sp. API 0066]